MRFLLTSGGITNASIPDSLVDLLGKPIAECGALCIPTAIYAFPGGAAFAYRLITGSAASPLCGLGWKSLGVLELTALPSIDKSIGPRASGRLTPCWWEAATPLYLCYWMQQSGLAGLLLSLRRTVYVGVSAGSLVMGPNVGEQFVYGNPLTGGDRALGMVDFSMFPHLEHEDMPDHSLANAETWAAGISGAGYATDDQNAIRVVDGTVEVVSEGQWKLFQPHPRSKRIGLEATPLAWAEFGDVASRSQPDPVDGGWFSSALYLGNERSLTSSAF